MPSFAFDFYIWRDVAKRIIPRAHRSMELPLRWISYAISNFIYGDWIGAVDHMAGFVDCAARGSWRQRDA